MKKRITAVVLIVIIISVYYVLRLPDNTSSKGVEGNQFVPNPTTAQISEEVEIDCNGGSVVFENDTHGGFLNDGIAFYVVAFDDESIQSEIIANNYWNELPVDRDLAKLIDNKVKDENMNQYIPDIEEGYYFFYNRESDHMAKGYVPGMLEDSSRNFTIAIYDIKEQKLYFCKYDS